MLRYLKKRLFSELRHQILIICDAKCSFSHITTFYPFLSKSYAQYGFWSGEKSKRSFCEVRHQILIIFDAKCSFTPITTFYLFLSKSYEQKKNEIEKKNLSFFFGNLSKFYFFDDNFDFVENFLKKISDFFSISKKYFF